MKGGCAMKVRKKKAKVKDPSAPLRPKSMKRSVKAKATKASTATGSAASSAPSSAPALTACKKPAAATPKAKSAPRAVRKTAMKLKAKAKAKPKVKARARKTTRKTSTSGSSTSSEGEGSSSESKSARSSKAGSPRDPDQDPNVEWLINHGVAPVALQSMDYQEEEPGNRAGRVVWLLKFCLVACRLSREHHCWILVTWLWASCRWGYRLRTTSSNKTGGDWRQPPRDRAPASLSRRSLWAPLPHHPQNPAPPGHGHCHQSPEQHG